MAVEDRLVEEVFLREIDAVGLYFHALPFGTVGGRRALDLVAEIGVACCDTLDDILNLLLDVVVVLGWQAPNFNDGGGKVRDVGGAPMPVVSANTTVDAADDEARETREFWAGIRLEFDVIESVDDLGEFGLRR